MRWSSQLGPLGHAEVITENGWVLVRAQGRLAGDGFKTEVSALVKSERQLRLVIDLRRLERLSPETRSECAELGKELRSHISEITLVGTGSTINFILSSLRLAGVKANHVPTFTNLGLPPALEAATQEKVPGAL